MASVMVITPAMDVQEKTPVTMIRMQRLMMAHVYIQRKTMTVMETVLLIQTVMVNVEVMQ